MTSGIHGGDVQLYRRLLHHARPYARHIGGIGLLGLLATPLALLAPVPLQMAVDNVIAGHPVNERIRAFLPDRLLDSPDGLLAAVVLLVVAVALANQLREVAHSVLRTYTGERMVLDFRARLFHHAQRLSLAYHDTRGTSDSTYRIQYDTPSVHAVAIDGVIPFVTSTVTLLAMLYVVLRLDATLGLVALLVSPALFVLSGVYRKQLRRRSRAVKKLESAAQGVVQEVLAAVRVVKAFGQEGRESRRFERRSREGMRAKVRLSAVEGSFGLLLALVTALGTAAVLYVGVRHVRAGVITLGQLLLVMGYVSQLYGPLRSISKRAASIQSSLASAERAFALLDERPDVQERANARPLVRAAGAVSFRDVGFEYEQGHSVLTGISFDVAAGSRVGIAGVTGAGKSTLASLLPRFYDPTQGQILLDGMDLRDYRLADLRNQFAIVLQDTVLFSGSIGDNIAYARPGASHAEVVVAAKAAHAHDFISALPAGYDTAVGERGMRLSGGERQRIALARAFLKDAPLLILDEPTSAVDMATEAAIMAATEQLMRGRTTFMIAHRVSTLARCDVRIEIAASRIASLRRGDDVLAPRGAA